MPSVSLYIDVSEALVKELAFHLLMYGAIFFVAMIATAFCAGLILGRLWPTPRTLSRSNEAELTSGAPDRSPDVR